tara:strand:+ start:1598 stop:1774 length:177 start_codon:yes stop_codon:yes gene_type:complete
MARFEKAVAVGLLVLWSFLCPSYIDGVRDGLGAAASIARARGEKALAIELEELAEAAD